MFDLEKIKEESGLSAIELARLEEEVRREFESDEMMFELHPLRALRAIRGLGHFRGGPLRRCEGLRTWSGKPGHRSREWYHCESDEGHWSEAS